MIQRVTRSPDGIRIAYEARGSGVPALVFVHGWSCDRTYWSEQLQRLDSRYRVVAIDLAGHGESGIGRTEWTMPAFGDDVVAVVDDLGLRDVVLVGHSMGGDVVVEAALHLQDRLSGVVWVDAYDTLEAPPLTVEGAREFLRPFRKDFVTATRAFVRGMFPASADPALAERIAADMSAAPPEIALNAMEHSITNHAAIIAGLRALTAPVVAINPDYRSTDVESLRRHRVRTVLMPSVGHFPQLEEPAAFNKLLGQAIDDVHRPEGQNGDRR